MIPAEAVSCYDFEGITVVPSAGQVFVDGQRVLLTQKEFDLLLFLASHAGMTLHRDQILKKLRGVDAALVTRSVDVLVGRLRRKLQDSKTDPRFIQTVWGQGYQFIADPRAIYR